MSRNQKIVLEMLEAIERTRAGGGPLEELEQKLWRLLEGADQSFPAAVAHLVDELVNNLRYLKRENLGFPGVDEDRGADVIYNEVLAALSRVLG